MCMQLFIVLHEWQRGRIPNNVHEKTLAILRQLLGKVRLHDNYTMQIVHSDLSGNILFDDVFAPLIIDFSPKIAPVEYAEAILIIDCIAWQGSPMSHLKEFMNTEFRQEMVIRALIFRLSIPAIFSADDFDGFYRHYQPFADIVDYMS